LQHYDAGFGEKTLSHMGQILMEQLKEYELMLHNLEMLILSGLEENFSSLSTL
jgi:hypothetical protein